MESSSSGMDRLIDRGYHRTDKEFHKRHGIWPEQDPRNNGDRTIKYSNKLGYYEYPSEIDDRRKIKQAEEDDYAKYLEGMKTRFPQPTRNRHYQNYLDGNYKKGIFGYSYKNYLKDLEDKTYQEYLDLNLDMPYDAFKIRRQRELASDGYYENPAREESRKIKPKLDFETEYGLYLSRALSKNDPDESPMTLEEFKEVFDRRNKPIIKDKGLAGINKEINRYKSYVEREGTEQDKKNLEFELEVAKSFGNPNLNYLGKFFNGLDETRQARLKELQAMDQNDMTQQDLRDLDDILVEEQGYRLENEMAQRVDFRGLTADEAREYVFLDANSHTLNEANSEKLNRYKTRVYATKKYPAPPLPPDWRVSKNSVRYLMKYPKHALKHHLSNIMKVIKNLPGKVFNTTDYRGTKIGLALGLAALITLTALGTYKYRQIKKRKKEYADKIESKKRAKKADQLAHLRKISTRKPKRKPRKSRK